MRQSMPHYHQHLCLYLLIGGHGVMEAVATTFPAEMTFLLPQWKDA